MPTIMLMRSVYLQSRSLGLRRLIAQNVSTQFGITAEQLRPASTVVTPSSATSQAAVPNADQLAANPYYQKYQERLQQKLQEKQQLDAAKQHKQTTPSPSPLPSKSSPHMKPLSEIINFERFSECSADEIAYMWREFHANKKETIAAAIPGSVFREMYLRAKNAPLFVSPTPKQEGFETMACQWEGSQCMVTSLLEYKTHAEYAAPYLSITYYTDFLDSKDVVLMYGKPSGALISNLEGQFIAAMIQIFYSTSAFEHVRVFNHEPTAFNFEAVLDIVKEQVAKIEMRNLNAVQ